MHGLRTLIFGTPGRRWAALFLANLLFYGLGWLIHRYILTSASSPGLSFVLVATWMAMAALTALVTVIALGELLFHPGWSKRFLRDEMAELDARIDRGARGEAEPEPDAELDEMVLHGDSTIRFGVYFFLVTALNILLSNSLSAGFLQQYSHPGVALVHMRSDEPKLRREGLDMLATRLDFEVTPSVEKVVLAALADADEGVAARGAFVAGVLGVRAAVDRLAAMAQERPALTFAALIALGQVSGAKAREAARSLAESPVARAEPRALAYMLGLLRVPAVEVLRSIHEQAADDEGTRVAAVWALGELREERLLDFMVEALEDPSLAVRCAAAGGLERMIVFDAAPPLMAAFERAEDPEQRCPEVVLPVQEGGPKIIVVPYRHYQFALLRALASTDHPDLLTWLVKTQNPEKMPYRTHTFMEKMWKSLKQKEAKGELNALKERVRMRRLQRKMGQRDAGADDTGVQGDAGRPPDAGVDGGAR